MCDYELAKEYWKEIHDKGGFEDMKIPTADKSGSDLEFKRPLIPEGFYEAQLLDVKDLEPGKFGERVAFIYKVITKNVELAHVTYVPPKATPDNKFGKVLLAHKQVLDGREVDTDTLIDQKVIVVVENYDLKDEEGIPTGEQASTVAKVKPLENSLPEQTVSV